MAKMHFKICLLALLLTAFSLASGLQDESDGCKHFPINCECGIGNNKTYIELQLETMVEHSNEQRNRCVAVIDPHQACANLSCRFTLNGSESGLSGPDFLSNFYPIEISILPGELPESHRFIREAITCQLPPLKNAAIKCWKWPGWMTCDITCIYGHAFSDGRDSVTTTSANCRHSENIWKPQEIEDCKPYFNCKARLVKPGSLKCKEPLDAPAYCEISCLDYDDFEATSLQKYECNDETFESKLPHCAVLKKEASIIRKPY